MRRVVHTAFVLLPLLALAACSRSESAKEQKPATTAELEIASVGNQMKFNKETLTVKEGEPVHLTFHNNSTLDVLPHNWVLVKPGTEAKVAADGLAKGKEAGYLDPASKGLMVHTRLADKGKTVDVTFTAPAKGKYPYICTVPGHYVVMHGTLIVTS